MAEVCREHGVADATVTRVVACAGVSRRTFYEIFEDREECFLATFDEAAAQASRYVSDGFEPDGSWVEQLRTALSALLWFLDMEPCSGWLLVVASLGAGSQALERRRRILAQMTAFVDRGRQVKAGTELPALTAEGVVGGALSVIHARMLDGESGALSALAGPLAGMIVLPYLGPAASRRELMRSTPEPRETVSLGAGDPLRDLGMRLTYRTVCVLMTVAARPGSSNREVGVAAGISDQGQMSKLLGRLERLGLVHNKGGAPGSGMPNAWMLTGKGIQVEHATSGENVRPILKTSTGSAR
jgi:AcrR family transcriptional regulator